MADDILRSLVRSAVTAATAPAGGLTSRQPDDDFQKVLTETRRVFGRRSASSRDPSAEYLAPFPSLIDRSFCDIRRRQRQRRPAERE